MAAQKQQESLQDVDILQNLLNEAKYTAYALNLYILEASSEDLRRDYMTVLGEVYAQQKQVYDLMEQKGVYSPKRAQKQDVTQVENKFKQNQQNESGESQQMQ